MIVYEENLLNGIIALAPLGNFCQWRMEAFGLRTAQMSFFSFSHDFYGDLEHIPNIISHQASMNYLCKLFQRHSGRSQSEASRFPCKQRHLWTNKPLIKVGNQHCFGGLFKDFYFCQKGWIWRRRDRSTGRGTPAADSGGRRSQPDKSRCPRRPGIRSGPPGSSCCLPPDGQTIWPFLAPSANHLKDSYQGLY